MEFAYSKCSKCGVELGDKKPEKVTRLKEPYDSPYGRTVEYVGPCPSCGEDIPLWAGIAGDVPDIEPGTTKTVRGKAAPKAEPETTE